jgi:hypothetical protein
LSQCLISEEFNNVQEAIAAYEKQMRKRASATAQDSLDAAEAFHSPGAIEAIISVIS